MKLLVISDTHLKSTPSNDLVDPDTNRSTRFEENVEALLGVLAAGKAAGCTGLLHGGDWVDGRNPKSVELEACAYLLNAWMKDGGRVWGVDGNHDRAIAKLSGSSVGPLSIMRRDGFKLYSEVGFDEELQALMVPYIHRATVEELTAQIAAAMATRNVIGDAFKLPVFALAHYGLKGCKMAAKGITIQADYLAAEQFAACQGLDVVLAGHIHHGQTLQLTESITGHIIGSPLVENHGESEDCKSYLIFDTVTRGTTRHLVPQPRRWLTVDFATAQTAPIQWSASDIVKLVGTYEPPAYPKDDMEAAFAAGLPRPFSLTYEVKKAAVARAVRSLEVIEGASLGDKVKFYARDNFPSGASSKPGQMEAAVTQAVSAIEDQGLVTYAPLVTPVAVAISNFRTFKTVVHAFKLGEPTLITGRNGIGKTNFNEAVFFCLTGESSKGKTLSAAVNQNEAEASVTLTVAAGRADEKPVLYRIGRSVKVNKKGQAAQKLSLHKQEADESWTDLSDGGVEDTQAIINNLVGGSPRALRTTNFQFQKDKESLVGAKPTERQAIIGEIGGLLPMQKAFKALDEQRKTSNRAAEDAEARMTGLLAASDGAEARLEAAKADLGVALQEEALHAAALPAAQTAEDQALATRTAAEAKVADLQAQLDALPNTAAALAGAEQSLKTYQDTYEKGHAAKLERHATLKVSIAQSEAALKALQAPDPAAVKALEGRVAAALQALEAATAAATAASGDLRAAEAASEGAKKAADGAREAVKEAQAWLDGLGAPVAFESLQGALATAEGMLTRAEAEVTAISGRTVALKAEVTAKEKERGDLREERAAFDGQDVGACSKCGHPLDSSHMVAELARIDTALAEADVWLTAKATEAQALAAELGTAALAKIQAQGIVKAAREAAETAKLAEARRVDLTKAVTDGEAKAGLLLAEANARAAALSAVSNQATILGGAVAPLKAAHDTLAAELKAAQSAGAEIGRLQGQLEAQRKQFDENLEAGKAEAKAYDAEVVRLGQVVSEALVTHTVNDAAAGALRTSIAQAQPAVAEAVAAWGHARVVAEQIRGALAAAKKSQEDANGRIQTVTEQLRAVEAFKFELATLKERAEIDTLAANLLDPRKGVPNTIIDGMLPFLQERVNEYMEAMGMGRLAIELTTLDGDKETLAILVDNGRPGRKLDIAEYSGSQVDRIEYALKCAMGDLQRQARGVTFGYTCFDEPAGLDEEGTRGLVQLLRDRCVHYPASYIVSHDERLIRSFDSRLQFSQGPADETLVA